MNEITCSQYWKEIDAITEEMCWDALNETKALDEASEQIFDYRLHELVDSHQWVIYNYYNQFVMQHSNNVDYMVDNFGSESAGDILKERGLNVLHNSIAFWCMYADISDKVQDTLEKLDNELAEA